MGFYINLLLTLSVVLPLTAQATPRHDELICEEVAEVLYEAVAYGTISKQIADEVTDDCYTYFLKR